MNVTREQLLAYAAGELKGESARAVESFLVRDQTAASLVKLYQDVATAHRSDTSVEVPAAVLESAKSIFDASRFAPQRGSLVERAAESVARLVASLTYDSRVATAGLRSSLLRDAYQLSFNVDGLDADLHIQRPRMTEHAAGAPARFRVMGQVSGGGAIDAGEVSATRLRAERSTANARTNEFGEFQLELPAGVYDITIRWSDRLLCMERVEIG
jgi:hypothetical protein